MYLSKIWSKQIENSQITFYCNMHDDSIDMYCRLRAKVAWNNQYQWSYLKKNDNEALEVKMTMRTLYLVILFEVWF